MQNKIWTLLWSFLKIGTFTFGGGLAMIPLIEREICAKRGWIKKEEFLELLTLAQSAPGPIALNTAVFVGYRVTGYWGAIAAVLGVVIPSFSIILLIAIFFRDYQNYPTVEAVFRGLRPAVVALIVAPLLYLSKGMGRVRIGVAIVVALMVWKLPFSPIYYIVAGGICGIGYAIYSGRKGGER